MSAPNAPKQRVPWMAWWLWWSAACFYLYENSIQVSLSVMAQELVHDFHMTAASLSLLGSVYLWAYGLCQLPVGLMLDRYGVRWPLTLGVFLCAGGAALFAVSNGWVDAALGRLLIGAGSAFAAVGCMQLAGDSLPPERFAIMTGLLLSMGMGGQMAAERPLANWLLHMPWRDIMLWIASAGVLLGLWLFTVLRHHPRQQHVHHPVAQALGFLTRQRNVWLTATYGMLMFTPFLIFSNLWGVPFVMQALNIDRPEAAGILSLIQVGFAAGAPLLGWCSDHWKRRKPMLLISTLGAAACTASIVYVPHRSHVVLSLELLMFGVLTSGFLPSFSVMKESVPTPLRASALGFMNTFNMLGAAVCLPIVGTLMEALHPVTTSLHPEPGLHYSLASFRAGLSLCMVAFTLALLCLRWVPETFARDHHAHDHR